MTQEDKQLLLKDLCARLPYYGLICQTNKGKGTLISLECSFGEDLVYVDFGYSQTEEFDLNEDDEVKPYLRPLSSMTEDEENEYRAINCYEGLFPHNEDALDYALEHHLDFRGLIPMGLALEAPKDMYKTE